MLSVVRRTREISKELNRRGRRSSFESRSPVGCCWDRTDGAGSIREQVAREGMTEFSLRDKEIPIARLQVTRFGRRGKQTRNVPKGNISSSSFALSGCLLRLVSERNNFLENQKSKMDIAFSERIADSNLSLVSLITVGCCADKLHRKNSPSDPHRLPITIGISSIEKRHTDDTFKRTKGKKIAKKKGRVGGRGELHQ